MKTEVQNYLVMSYQLMENKRKQITLANCELGKLVKCRIWKNRKKIFNTFTGMKEISNKMG